MMWKGWAGTGAGVGQKQGRAGTRQGEGQGKDMDMTGAGTGQEQGRVMARRGSCTAELAGLGRAGQDRTGQGSDTAGTRRVHGSYTAAAG